LQSLTTHEDQSRLPIKVEELLREVTYKLEFPVNSKIHNVFAVSTLLPYQVEERLQEKEPEDILDKITVKRRRMTTTKVLVKRKHELSENFTWEFYYDMTRKYPSFHF